MNEKLLESVSALIDGEADELELRRLLATADSEIVRAAWRDYHLQRDSLHGVDMQFAQVDLSGRIQAALADETVAAVAPSPRWRRSLASIAVAASVATVVVIGARSFSPSAEIGEVAKLSTPAVTPVYPARIAPSVGAGNVAVNTQFYPAQPVALDANQLAEQRLQQYLLRHTERSALPSGQGLMGFVKVSQLDAE